RRAAHRTVDGGAGRPDHLLPEALALALDSRIRIRTHPRTGLRGGAAGTGPAGGTVHRGSAQLQPGRGNRAIGRHRHRRRAHGLDVEKTLVFQKGRSEEHTSELQSRENLVCRLLLEKKKYDLEV